MDWERVTALYEECAEKTPSRRMAHLREACGGDEELYREVASLLEAGGEAGDFLEVRRAPERAGPWRLVEKIGAGGIGVVWRAERDDGQFDQEVAVKFLRRGAETEQMGRYFQSERKIMAQLRHPNIARLLDAGVTGDGRMWFAMELVEGVGLVEYAAREGLGRRPRLELFEKICGAVQHAHGHLVVHRDIKPGNILVGADGEPKLLDFGVAKILEQEREGASQTGPHLTPEYASPEQLRGEPVTTATDVYALGVVLYELLAGRRPYLIKTSALHELAAAICDQEPAAPTGDRDLDLIVLTALEKEPARRYGSAAKLGEDLRRYLDGYPITARKPTVAYRVGRFARRNRWGVAAGALVALSLAGGMAGTLWQYRIARAERAMVEQRFNEVRRLSRAVLFEFHDAIAELPGATPARALLLARAVEYLDRLAASKPADPGLRRELAEAYLRAGDIGGDSGRSNLGDEKAARALYLKANALLAGAAPEDRAALSLLARSYNRLEGYENAEKAMRIYARLAEAEPTMANWSNLATGYYYVAMEVQKTKNYAGALAWRDKELELRKKVYAAMPGDRDAVADLALCHKRIGGLQILLNRLEEARGHYEAALELEERWVEREPLSPNAKLAVTFSLNDLAIIDDRQGRVQKSAEGYLRSLRMREELAREDPKNQRMHEALLSGYVRTAAALRSAGRGAEADLLLKKARGAEWKAGEVDAQQRAMRR